jgi:hypothetical protein
LPPPLVTVMPSPFPGMNPFLEQNDSWEDFHANFIARIQEKLSGEVGDNYLVKIEVRVLLHELSADERHFIGEADVGIAGPRLQGTASSMATLPSPELLHFPAVNRERHKYLEIRDRRSRRLVTVIELLSPSNKSPGPDRDDYLSKRTQYVTSGVQLVEIDLRRGGVRPGPPLIPACDYYVAIGRYPTGDVWGLWRVGLRERLPTIPVPLAPPDADVPLDLQEVLHRTYDAAGYAKYIYQETPDPPLPPEDAAWARKIAEQEIASRTTS